MSTHKPIDSTPEQLAEMAREMQRCASELHAVSEAMKSAGFEKLTVLNFTSLSNAVKGSNKFVKAARDAIWDAKQQVGSLGDLAPAKPKPRKKSAK